MEIHLEPICPIPFNALITADVKKERKLHIKQNKQDIKGKSKIKLKLKRQKLKL